MQCKHSCLHPLAILLLHGIRRLHASYDSPLAAGRQGVVESLPMSNVMECSAFG